jgi:hypothetical protein
VKAVDQGDNVSDASNAVGFDITCYNDNPEKIAEGPHHREIGEPLPDKFSLNPNFPNPFNPVTQINYALPEDIYVTLRVYDVLGREVAKLVDGVEAAGYKTATFDGSHLPSGVYFYRLTTSKYSSIKKMILAK